MIQHMKIVPTCPHAIARVSRQGLVVYSIEYQHKISQIAKIP